MVGNIYGNLMKIFTAKKKSPNTEVFGQGLAQLVVPGETIYKCFLNSIFN